MKILVLTTLILSGCATATEMRGPDGTASQLIEGINIESCYDKASEVCGGKYKIINSIREESKTKLLVKCEK